MGDLKTKCDICFSSHIQKAHKNDTEHFEDG